MQFPVLDFGLDHSGSQPFILCVACLNSRPVSPFPPPFPPPICGCPQNSGLCPVPEREWLWSPQLQAQNRLSVQAHHPSNECVN